MPEQLNIRVIDNGKGFNQEKEHLMPEGMGLYNIFKRAKIIGGEAIINSVITKGTTVSIFSPYE
ncbi:Histidine kinase-, DNA gyrase B-, and HSP90-like ATPase [compost metagenome]